jgi:hypothetical protein
MLVLHIFSMEHENQPDLLNILEAAYAFTYLVVMQDKVFSLLQM